MRTNLFTYVKSKFPVFDHCNENEQFIWLMSNLDPDIINVFTTYVHTCFTKRRNNTTWIVLTLEIKNRNYRLAVIKNIIITGFEFFMDSFWYLFHFQSSYFVHFVVLLACPNGYTDLINIVNCLLSILLKEVGC